MGIQINGQTDTISAIDGGITVATDLTVPGVLSYEDVTNIDSVGVITARSGIRVTSGSVGIGTDNPQGTLSVGGNISLDVALGTIPSRGGITRHTNNYTYFVGKNDGAGAILNNGDGTATVRAESPGGSNGFLLFETGNGAERLRITGIGSVGINRTNPNALLEIDSGGSYGIRGTIESRVGQSKRFIGKWGSSATYNVAIVDGGTPRGQSRLGGFVVTYTYRSRYGFDGDGGGHGIRMLSGAVRDSGEWGFDTETTAAVGDTPVPTLQGTDNSDGTCTIQLVNPSSTHSFGEFNLIVWDCDIISPTN